MKPLIIKQAGWVRPAGIREWAQGLTCGLYSFYSKGASMKRYTAGLTVLAALVVSSVAPGVQAQDRDASLYVGVKSCKMCHKKEEAGNQLQKWMDGPHAKAFAVLASDESKAAAAKLGIDDPQQSGKCLKCHSTAYNFTETVQSDKPPVDEGVSCESCHGPGKNYKSKKVMQVLDDSIAAGMIHPATKSCTLCHNDTSPTWNPERYTTKDGKKVGFDEEQAYEKIKHLNPNLHP
jgi:hypothetical protein